MRDSSKTLRCHQPQKQSLDSLDKIVIK